MQSQEDLKTCSLYTAPGFSTAQGNRGDSEQADLTDAEANTQKESFASGKKW